MNQNTVVTTGWSNPESEQRYRANWPDDPAAAENYDSGRQCGGCSFYAKFNFDFGLCCQPRSPHLTETVFEHFTCAEYVDEGWEAHSFRQADQ